MHSSVNFNKGIHLCYCCQIMIQNISIILETALMPFFKQSGNVCQIFINVCVTSETIESACDLQAINRPLLHYLKLQESGVLVIHFHYHLPRVLLQCLAYSWSPQNAYWIKHLNAYYMASTVLLYLGGQFYYNILRSQKHMLLISRKCLK